VTVSAGGGASTTTDATGHYTLASLSAGARVVTVTPPAGYITATQGTDAATVQVTASQTTTLNFPLIRGVLVTAQNTSFSPDTVTIPVGATVRWLNNSTVTHTVTPDNGTLPGSWASASLVGASAFQHTFTVAGTFGYHCIPHEAAGMKGAVIVTP
jgi:plastocyanin